MEFPWDKFPPINYVISYGSSFFRQSHGHKNDPLKQFDFLCVIDEDHYDWHNENLKNNSSHYSFVRLFGAKQIAHLQVAGCVPVYYNTFVRLAGQEQMFKYGIINEQDLIQDLNCWENFYISGRLQKPVYIQPSSNYILPESFKTAFDLNRLNALRLSLLLLPHRFSLYDLFYKICCLSYQGDIRLKHFESANKISNLVTHQWVQLYDIYLPLINQLSDYMTCPPSLSDSIADLSRETTRTHKKTLKNAHHHTYTNTGTTQSNIEGIRGLLSSSGFSLESDLSNESKTKLFEALPQNFRKTAESISLDIRFRKLFSPLSLFNKSRLSHIYGHPMPFEAVCISKALHTIVRKSSLHTTLKSALTAGFLKSVRYGLRKMRK